MKRCPLFFVAFGVGVGVGVGVAATATATAAAATAVTAVQYFLFFDKNIDIILVQVLH